MADQLSLRGGTTTEHATFTGANKEVTVDTTKKTLVVNDGATVGGHPLMRENASNSALALGSAGTPSLKFTGDTNTGIYSPGADQLAVATNGTGRLFVDASGNLLVGTYDNSGGLGERLSINGAGLVTQSAAATNRGIFGTFGTSTQIIGAFDNIPLEFRTNNTERLRITAAGLVGVGASAPATLLEVRSATTNAARLRVTGTGTTAGNFRGFEFGNGSVFKGGLLQDESTDLISIFTPVGGQSVNITSAGLVGIGTSSPVIPLDVNTGAAGSPVTGFGTSGADPFIHLERFTGGTNYDAVRISAAFGAAQGGILTISNGTGASKGQQTFTERFRIDSSGRVGIGTTSPGENLTISSNVAATTVVSINAPSGQTSKLQFKRSDTNRVNIECDASDNLKFYSDASAAERARIDSSGRLLVGTSSQPYTGGALIVNNGIGIVNNTTNRFATVEHGSGATGSTFTTITISAVVNSSSSSVIFETLMTGFSGVYLDNVSAKYSNQATVTMRNNASAGTSATLTVNGANTLYTLTITTSVINPVVKVKVTGGGITDSIALPTITFA
jgi:hypothetical protein